MTAPVQGWWRFSVTIAALGLLLPPSAASAADKQQVPHGPPSAFPWVDLPEFGGSEAIIYRSPDGKRVAAAFRERGKFTFRYSFDEFLVVTSGTGRFTVEGGPSFVLKTGDTAYFREGMTVHMDLSDDFSDVTMLVADHPVKWR